MYALIALVFANLTSVVAKFGMKDMNSDSALVVRTEVAGLRDRRQRPDFHHQRQDTIGNKGLRNVYAMLI